MPKIALPTPLRPYAGGLEAVAASGGTVAEALHDLTVRHPALRRHLFDEQGRLRSFVNVYKGDEDVRFLDGAGTALGEEDTLTLVPSIAGGAPGAGSDTTAAEPALSNEEIRRYSRHLIIPEVGLAGQRKLKAARVLCVGAGGLGSPLTLYLAAAGVGTLGVVDFDVVDDSNLQRQILHGTSDVGRPKLVSAAARLHEINPNVRVVPHETRLTSGNALDLLRDYDVIADGTDNFPTRYLVNDACVLLGKPNVYASIYRFEGQASVFWAERGPCYRCLYREPPPPGLVPSCAEGGVLGILPGLLGVIQATETVKLLLGIGEPLVGRLLLVDALGMRFRELKLRKDPDCVLCGERATQRTLVDYEQFCGLSTSEAEPTHELTVEDLAGKIERGEEFVLLDVREPHEVEIASLPGARNVPLRELPEQLGSLDPARDLIVLCKVGGRSARAVALLRGAGFRRVWNVSGGIDRWAERIDPRMPRY
jgi:molybdopterin/thiamine biosynthesis adenylyltransferase/rhodanese-related sulfurtransferase/molybdopterin converting factor small subunit